MGARVSVQWGKGGWYEGVMQEWSAAKQQHFVKYDDRYEKWYNMSEKTYRVL